MNERHVYVASLGEIMNPKLGYNGQVKNNYMIVHDRLISRPIMFVMI